jgi:hypothetical protein
LESNTFPLCFCVTYFPFVVCNFALIFNLYSDYSNRTVTVPFRFRFKLVLLNNWSFQHLWETFSVGCTSRKCKRTNGSGLCRESI